MGNVLIIGDTHEPFTHKHYLDFCLETKKKYKCSLTYHIGDVADFHAISNYDHDPDGYSPYTELQKTIKKLKKWYKAFPKVKGVCIGNHDERMERAACGFGFSRSYFRPLRTILEFPKGWGDFQIDYYIYGVRIFHGMGYSGVNAHKNAAVENQQSIVMGHLHSNAGTWWTANEHSRVFGLAVGCGVDRKSWAFRYGRDLRRKPILGCGVVLENADNAFFEPMKL